MTISVTPPHLYWIVYDDFTQKLSSASRLEITRELREMGWKVTLVSIGMDGSRVIEEVENYCISAPTLYLIGQIVFHLKAILHMKRLQQAPDIVFFTQDSLPYMLPLWFWRKLVGKKRPIYVMDTRTLHMPDIKNETIRGRLRRWFLELMNAIANYWTDGQTAITIRMAESLKIPQRKLWGVWTSGVHLNQFKSAITARQWPRQGEAVHLLYVGSLSLERNIHSLCQAVIEANREGMKFVFTIVGSGEAKDYLEQIARGSNGSVVISPPVPHREVPSILAQGHLGVLPFPDEEKFRVSSPIKLFEYMAAGLPILAQRMVCHTDVVGNEAFVFWADQANPQGFVNTVRQIWSNVESLSKMGQQAANAAQNWTWHSSAQRLKAALEMGLELYS